jgi:putative tryptophan/tyrosine transport system substrate-binding protein
MDRRAFLLASMALCARPAAAQPRMARVAVMTAPPLPNALLEAFRRGMSQQGYIEGKNLELILRSAEGRSERFPALAAEIVKLNPAVIVSGGGAPSARAAMRATKSIPIVFPASGDPVAEGLVQSLSRPGGNVTGFSIINSEVSGKRIQLLRDLMPAAKRIAIFQDSVGRAGVDQIWATEESARQSGIQIVVLMPARPEDYESNFIMAKGAGADGVIVLPSSSFNANRQKLIALSAQHALPTVWENRLFAESGGLVSCGPDIADLYRESARLVDKILKGAKPADLPVERASKFELIVNVRTAKSQGIAIPPAFLVRADRIIE